MTTRALVALDGPFGNFKPGQTIRGIDGDTVDAWVAAGVAEHVADPAPAVAVAPASDELASLKRADLVQLAKSLGLKAGGTADDLRARIAAASPKPE